MGRALLLVLVACGGGGVPARAPAPAPRSLAVVPRVARAGPVTDDAQDHVPYVEPPPPDWTAPPPAFELPVLPAAATSYATISRIVVVDRAGGVTRGDHRMPLPDQIDPATLAPPPRPPPPPPAPGDKPPPRITGIGGGPLATGPLTIEMPKRTMPQHLSGVVADWAGNTISLATLVFAHRDNGALHVYDAIRSEFFVTSTALAVTTDGGVRAFRMTFDGGIGGGIDRAYLEVALAGAGARVQAIVADKPAPKVFDRAAPDAKAIALAYSAARKLPQLGKGVTVWIQLGEDVTYGRLVEVLEGLRAAGAVHTAVSRMRPISEPFAFGGLVASNAVLGKVEAPGNFAAIARRYLKRNMKKVDYCYEKELLAKSGLAGEVKLEFTIDPGGAVDKLTSTGVDGEVSSCIGKVVKAIAFPRPQNGVEITVRTTIQLASPSAKKQ